ncbi:helix-turn-helix domain-containing protein [Halomonas sp. BC04]|uniref:helix-turn-helix domain-containing protein n=1 Tax=Halomonas sp. BC04 TaxID=1403540 RepID=UPI0009DCE6C4|nr:helix-turn-helix transcriptional regulator [Halomonas sp. BC04]
MTGLRTIGYRLRKLMDEHGISENELAKRSGVPQPSIHRIVNDKIKSPKYENVTKLARALGVSPEYLMHGEPSTDDTGSDGPAQGEALHTLASVSLGKSLAVGPP